MSSAPVQDSFDDLGTQLSEVTFCVVDLETTGGAETDAITEFGAVKVRGGEIVGRFQTLVNPKAAIPPLIAVLTGIDSAEPAVAATLALASTEAVTNLVAETGNVYALAYADDSFDVAHAHQVLQHLSDPVAALLEMRRVVRPGGLVAARDADYAAMTWYPTDPRLDRWLELYHQVARAAGGEPDAARRMRHWARQAGFTEITCTATTWCFADDEDVAWWSQTWAERVVSSSFATQALAGGFADQAELADLSTAFRWWGEQPDAWFAVLHGEVLAVA
jgi:SAM-dependent methyltransferase